MDEKQHYNACRDETVREISECERTSSMLGHLAQAIRHSPNTPRSQTYPDDAVAAMLHGSDLAAEKARNLRHCVGIWDKLIAEPVPEPQR